MAEVKWSNVAMGASCKALPLAARMREPGRHESSGLVLARWWDQVVDGVDCYIDHRAAALAAVDEAVRGEVRAAMDGLEASRDFQFMARGPAPFVRVEAKELQALPGLTVQLPATPAIQPGQALLLVRWDRVQNGSQLLLARLLALVHARPVTLLLPRLLVRQRVTADDVQAQFSGDLLLLADLAVRARLAEITPMEEAEAKLRSEGRPDGADCTACWARKTCPVAAGRA